MKSASSKRAGYGTGKTLPPRQDAMKATAAGQASPRNTAAQSYSTGRKGKL